MITLHITVKSELQFTTNRREFYVGINKENYNEEIIKLLKDIKHSGMTIEKIEYKIESD